VRFLSVVAASLAFAASAHAARPFVTDDARVVRPGGCQIESFARQLHSPHGAEYWFLPACNPLERLELTAGARSIGEEGEPTTHAVILQAKALLRALEPNGTGYALTLGSLRDRPGAGWSRYVNGIASHSFANDLLILHANVGALRDPATARRPHTWGIGGELAFTRRISGIAETYGQRNEPTSRQLGVRYWITPDHIQVDGTFGTQRDTSWVSMGIRLLF
jgi:hypothetical protein